MQCLFLPACRQIIDHVKNPVGNPLCADCLNVRRCNPSFVKTVANTFFQLRMYIFHICACLVKQRGYCHGVHFKIFFFGKSGNPAAQCRLILFMKLTDIAVFLDSLIKLIALVNFFFIEDKIGCLKTLAKIFCQLVCS